MGDIGVHESRRRKAFGTIEAYQPWGVDTERGNRTDARVTAAECHCRVIWRGDSGEVWEYRWIKKGTVEGRMIESVNRSATKSK